jgi:hypothetical protein
MPCVSKIVLEPMIPASRQASIHRCDTMRASHDETRKHGPAYCSIDDRRQRIACEKMKERNALVLNAYPTAATAYRHPKGT